VRVADRQNPGAQGAVRLQKITELRVRVEIGEKGRMKTGLGMTWQELK